jgi:small-conductance mechanosensitive channel
MPFWHRLVIAAVVFAAVSVLARAIDWWLLRRPLPPEAVTRYRILRRSITVTILVVGFFSALLVIPQVRAVAGGLLASSAVLGVIIGFASQRTLGNFVAGLLIAISQPVRLGDRVTYAGEDGVIEEIGLTYTFIRTRDDARLVVPNEKLVSDTIRNASIRSRETFAEVTVQVPLTADLHAVVAGLREEVAGDREAAVFVSALDGNATVTIRARAVDDAAAQQLESDLRVRAQARLRSLGVWG